MVGEIMGVGAAAMGALAGKGAQSQSWENQIKLMDIQARLNQKNAKYSTGQAKELWNYTNFENQMEHIKNAGLSPGLIYGMGGAGGTTSGAGQANGVGLPQDQSVGMGLRAQELGLQMANAASQIKLNESQANKNEAEANKIKGVDTDVAQATMDNLIAQTANEKIKKGLIYADTRFKDAMEEFTRGKVDEVGWNVKNLMKSLEVADRNIQATDLDNELKERTMESNVKQAQETLKNTMADTLVKFSQGKLNQTQATALTEQVKQGWSSIGIQMSEKEQGWQQLEQNAQKIMNELKLGEKGLDIQQQNVIKDYVLGFGQMATQIFTTGMKLPGASIPIKGLR